MIVGILVLLQEFCLPFLTYTSPIPWGVQLVEIGVKQRAKTTTTTTTTTTTKQQKERKRRKGVSLALLPYFPGFFFLLTSLCVVPALWSPGKGLDRISPRHCREKKFLWFTIFLCKTSTGRRQCTGDQGTARGSDSTHGLRARKYHRLSNKYHGNGGTNGYSLELLGEGRIEICQSAWHTFTTVVLNNYNYQKYFVCGKKSPVSRRGLGYVLRCP